MTDAREFIKEMSIVKLNRNEDEWFRWSKKFIATTKVKKFANVIDGSTEVPSFSDYMQDGRKVIRYMNHVVYCSLLHCRDDEICFNLVDTAKTENLPDGDAALAWKHLLTRFEPA